MNGSQGLMSDLVLFLSGHTVRRLNFGRASLKEVVDNEAVTEGGKRMRGLLFGAPVGAAANKTSPRSTRRSWSLLVVVSDG